MQRTRSYWRRNRDEARAFIAMMGFGILFTAALGIGSYHHQEQPASFIEEPIAEEQQPEAYIIPNPCGLEVIGGCENLMNPYARNEQIENIVRRYAIDAGIDPDTAIRIANCESSMNPYARNEQSGAQGLFQFLPSTWEWIASPGDPYNPYDNARAFANWYPTHPHWWVCK